MFWAGFAACSAGDMGVTAINVDFCIISFNGHI